MPKQREWTERDVAILHELYEVREMTKQQLIQRFFEGNEKYGSRRLYMLRNEDMLMSEVHGYGSAGKRVRTAYYRLTEKGLRLLREKGKVADISDRARDLRWSVKQREHMTDVNELHFIMPTVPFMDSRAVKRKYSMNRGDLTLGAFSKAEDDLLIYIMSGQAQEKTLVKLIEEMRKFKSQSIGSYLVYAKSLSVKTHFERLSEKMGLVTGGVPLHVLPYDEHGIGITRHYILSNRLPELLAEMGIGKLVQVKGGGSDKYGFRYGLRPLGDETSATPYAIELLTGDPLILRRCLSAYHKGRSQTEGRRVVVICWEDDLPELQAIWEAETHVDFIGVPLTAVKTHFERIEEKRNGQ